MSTVVQAYRFALDPTTVQRHALASHCGAARFAFNWGLAQVTINLGQRQAERSYGIAEDRLTPPLSWSLYSLRKSWNAAKHEVAPWWSENSKEAYASGLANLADALSNWGASRTGKRRGRRMGFPKPKSKRGRWSCRFTTGAFGLSNSDRRHVQLPRIGMVRTHESTRKLARHLQRGTARIRSATVSYQRGRWHVSFSVEISKREAASATRGGTVGVDLGVQCLAVLSTGETIANPKHLQRAQRTLRRLQRQVSRRVGPDKRTQRAPSNRWSTTRDRVTRLHTKVANERRDGLHQLSTRLVREFDTIVIEDLNVAGMLRNRLLARYIADVGMGELRRQLDYKTSWHGRGLVVADRFYPSSKTCHDCGAAKAKLCLSERTFTCDHCGQTADRDHNAARNLAALVSEIASSASSPSCGATKNEPAGNPRKTTTSGGNGYRHGKTPRVNAAPQGDGSGTLPHVS
ncbi:putative transposase [Haloechinothrix alba]|uniref:Putative transposase n=1 Tax=Haloechinothrix alba TaxID=664784 RepID=A0A239A1Y3_9PSEU|nr:IS607 family element RNA-guided endonuclease TnpB [Haloechinothrix alba]SNR89665.1 putative transposase [Haloechinothrix alba]